MQFAALKIMTCEATLAVKEGKSDEIEMLKKVASADPTHNGFHHVIESYDTFEIPGPHGLHSCVLTEVLGTSVHDLRLQETNDPCLSPRLVKTIMRQVLLGLDYLHNACGILHTGASH